MFVYQSRRKDCELESVNGVMVVSQGRNYIDGISGMFNVPFGYSNTHIKAHISQALDYAPFHPKERFYTSDALEVSARLLDKAKMPGGATLFVNSGSEAIEACITMALEYHKRRGNPTKRKVICRRHSYHGATLGAHSITGRNDFAELRNPGYDTIRVNPPFPVSHHGEALEVHQAKDVEAMINYYGADSVACFVYEPVNHLKGMHATPINYLREMRDICDKYDILMVADEIVTGAHRTGPFLHSHCADIVPDIAALGKGISGGYYPASVMLTTAKVKEEFPHNDCWVPFPYSHTYAGNSVSVYAIKGALDVLDELVTDGQIARLSEQINSACQQLAKQPGVIRAEPNGCLVGVTLDSELGPNSGKALEAICFDKQVIVRGDENWIALAPAYTTPAQTLEKIFEVLHDAIDQLRKH